MSKRPTIQDLAREAGVGVATVDRVLNGRPNVSERSIQRVAEAADKLGYYSRTLSNLRDHNGAKQPLTFGFLLLRENPVFYKQVAKALEKAVAARSDVLGTIQFHHADTLAPADFVREFKAMAGSCDAIGAVSLNHQSVTRAVAELRTNGTPVIAMLNDFAQGERYAYIGQNNMKSGRIAAWMLALQARSPGKMAVFVGGNRWHGHVLRETGFHSYFREYAPDFQMLDTVVNLDTPQVTYEATIDLLNRHPDLRGIYVAGGGMEGAIAALREMRPAGKVGLVINENTETGRAALAERYACLSIATPLKDMCETLVDQMVKAAADPARQARAQHFLEPQLLVPESI
jgi:LacI family transcriptional regulator